jgi:hypothetical protein
MQCDYIIILLNNNFKNLKQMNDNKNKNFGWFPTTREVVKYTSLFNLL